MLYKITINLNGSNAETTLSYKSKPSALSAWDNLVSEASGGDVLKLYSSAGQLMSQYEPVDREASNE